MEKAVKYNSILTNAVMVQNVSDMTEIIAQLIDEGHNITKEDMSYLSPYGTAHLNRFGDIVMDFSNIPRSIETVAEKYCFKYPGSRTNFFTLKMGGSLRLTKYGT